MYKYGFIHIPKTGGTSLRKVTKDNKSIKWLGHGHSYKFQKPKGWIFGTLTEFSYEECERIFTIVRNPFDLLISYYHSDGKKGWGNCNGHHGFKTWNEFLEAYINPNFQWHFPSLKHSLFSFIYDKQNKLLTDFYFKIEEKSKINVFLKENNCNELPHEHKSNNRKNTIYYDKKNVIDLNRIWERDLKYFDYEYNGQ